MRLTWTNKRGQARQGAAIEAGRSKKPKWERWRQIRRERIYSVETQDRQLGYQTQLACREDNGRLSYGMVCPGLGTLNVVESCRCEAVLARRRVDSHSPSRDAEAR